MTSQAFPSPVVGHGNHHHHSNGNAGNSCTNGGYSGSQTLPAGCNTNTQDWSSRGLNSNNCHSSSHNNNDEGDLDWWTISPKTMGLFALSLVFILIWTSVISGILVTHSYKEMEISSNGAELFVLQKQIGHFAFLLGKEMMHSISSHQGHHNETLGKERLFLMHKTDTLLLEMHQSFASKGLVELYEDLTEILKKFRGRCKARESDTEAASSLHSYTQITECIQAYEHQLSGLESFVLKDNPWLSERHAKLVQSDLILRNMPYTLFIKGVVHRFICLGIGTVLVNFDAESTSLKMSEYNHYFYSSRQLIESAFLWNQRFLTKYIDLENGSTELWKKIFEQRYGEERQSNDKLLALFHQLIGLNGLKRIRSEIKKKKAESVERIYEGSGTRSKYVADPNQILFHIKADFELEVKIEKIFAVKDHKTEPSTAESRMNLSMNYNQVIINQFDFLERVQDFLNISISAQLVQSQLAERHNFVYHTMVSAILICFVIFCLLLFTWSYCFSRNLPLTSPNANQPKMPWGRRMRRQFWALGASPLALLGACFSGASSTRSQRPSQSSVTGSNRYPLLYKSSNNHRSQSPGYPNGQTVNGSCNQCIPCSPSPSTFLLTSKRTWHRYLAATAHHQSHQHSHQSSNGGTNRHVLRANTSRNGHVNSSHQRMHSNANNETNNGITDRCHRSSSHGCCGACRDPSCTGSYNPTSNPTSNPAPPQGDQCVCHNCSIVGDPANDNAVRSTATANVLSNTTSGNAASSSSTNAAREEESQNDSDAVPLSTLSPNRPERRSRREEGIASAIMAAARNNNNRKENNYISSPSMMHKAMSALTRHASRESALSGTDGNVANGMAETAS